MTKAFPLQYERKKARKAFDILLITREQELKQLALDIGYPATGSDWQEKALLFCLDVNNCYIDLSRNEMDDRDPQMHDPDAENGQRQAADRAAKDTGSGVQHCRGLQVALRKAGLGR